MASAFGSRSMNVFAVLERSTSFTQDSECYTRHSDGETYEHEFCHQESGRFGLLNRLPTYPIKIGIIVIAAIVLCSELLFLAISPRPTDQKNTILSSQVTTAPALLSQWRDCGNSTQSALQRGCIFDILTISWETPSCYHTNTVNDFLQLKTWQPFGDVNGTSKASWDDVARAERRFHVNWDFHFTHCVYTWRMLQMAVIEKGPLEDNLLALEHTRHCSDMLLDRRWAWDNNDTLIHVKWPKCYPHGEWNDAHFVDTLDLNAL